MKNRNAWHPASWYVRYLHTPVCLVVRKVISIVAVACMIEPPERDDPTVVEFYNTSPHCLHSQLSCWHSPTLNSSTLENRKQLVQTQSNSLLSEVSTYSCDSWTSKLRVVSQIINLKEIDSTHFLLVLEWLSSSGTGRMISLTCTLD